MDDYYDWDYLHDTLSFGMTEGSGMMIAMTRMTKLTRVSDSNDWDN